MNGENIIRRLKVDLSELETAFDDTSWERSYYLDLETGNIVAVTDEDRRQLERIYEEVEMDETSDVEVDITPVLDKLSLPEWQKGALREADQVEKGFGVRYISIPRADSSEAYRDMEEFVDTVRNERSKDRLWNAISRNRPFRRFKDVLAGYALEEERWFRFKENLVRERMLEWLKEEGIELNKGPE